MPNRWHWAKGSMMETPTAIEVYLLKRDVKLLILMISASIIKQRSQLHNLKLPTFSLFIVLINSCCAYSRMLPLAS